MTKRTQLDLRKAMAVAAVLATAIALLTVASRVNAAQTAAAIANGGTATSTAPSYGSLLIGGKNGEYEFVASSTFGGFAPVQSVFGRTGAVTAQTGDYTTTQVLEGTNLYWTPTRFDTRLTATSSLPALTTLANLATVGTITSGTWHGTPIDNAYLANSSLTINGTSIALGASGKVTAASSTLYADNGTFSGANTFTGTTNFPSGIWNNSGNVGIGTTSPSNLLTVAGNAFVGGTLTVASASTGVGSTFVAGSLGNLTVASPSTIALNASNGNSISLQQSGTSRLQITTGGNVGVGTSTPNLNFTVSGLAAAPASIGSNENGLFSLNGEGGGSAASLTMGVFGYSWIQARFISSTSAALSLALNPLGGSVGVGTTSPWGALSVTGADALATTPGFVVANNSNTPLFSVMDNGNVGIGTTTPFSKFQVTSGANATTTVNFGEVGVSTSHACFNTKNTAGQDISFYFIGTSMIVESHLCR